MKRCLIITGGSIDLEFVRSYLAKEKFERIIAVDRGLAAAGALGLVPDAAVGDFDSVDPAILAEFRRQEHIVWEVHQPEKDDTDTELAIKRALAMGASHIVLLGATGGRLDHLLGNIHLLFPCLQRGVQASIVDPGNKLYLIDGEHHFKKKDVWGTYVSFLPLTEEVRGITLRGFKYPLTDRDISIGTSLCISNELEDEEASITFREGVLVVVESRDA